MDKHDREKETKSSGEVKEFDVKVTKKVEVCGTVGDLCDAFENDMRTKGCRHLFTLNHQYKILRQMKQSLGSNKVVLHIDFAENYNCKLSSEIQSFHFGASRNQMTLHNVAAYTPTGISTYSTLSNCLRHDPCAIWCYLHPVLEHVLENNQLVDIVRFISDSPATQYRCRSNFLLFCTQLYDIFNGKLRAASWDYMEAGHGKGAPDGIGAVLKRTADRLVSSGRDMASADVAFDALNSTQSHIKLFFVRDDEVQSASMEMIVAASAHVKSVSGTMKIRQIHSSEYGIMKHRMLSCYCSDDRYSLCTCFKSTVVDFAVSPKTSNRESSTSPGNIDTHTHTHLTALCLGLPR